MKQLLSTILCLYFFNIDNLQAQKSFTGIYQGTFWGSRCILSLKVSNNTVLGALYTGRNTHYNIIGKIENNTAIRANIDHTILGDGNILGSFPHDSIFADVLFERLAVPLRLKRISKSTTMDFDKYFGKPILDSTLFGYWKVISQFDRKGEPIKSVHRGQFLDKNGICKMDEIVRTDFANADVSWYTSDKHLYMNIKTNTQVMEVDMGQYSIKKDTLLLIGAGMFAGTKSVYVKSK